ncbi:sperm flagellar protein 2 isoform X2 [Scyliorhinus torazame]|uniref:sperm flagellar protein 2 isoform X2 n=1 Tax=Scyliorhinus torazame TaxID=75743 RepID=UPI003B58D6A2
MTEILCQWLNEELELSQRVETWTFARDFSTGYLIGEILNKHQLQDDFDQFSTGRNAISQLNNFQRLLPTLQLLGVMISDNVVQALVQQEPGVATRLLYQIYIALRRKEKAQLSKLAMETMRPPATAKLASISGKMYKERLRSMMPRDVDVKLQSVTKQFVALGKEIKEQLNQKHEEELQKQQSIQEQKRTESLQTLREAKRKNEELMAKIQASLIHIAKPRPQSLSSNIEKGELRKKQAELFRNEIHDFEAILKKLEPIGKDQERKCTGTNIFADTSTANEIHIPCVRVEEGQTFVANLRKRLDEDAKARKEREKRRRRVILDQLQAHEAQEEVYREEQLVNRLMRQSLQERRIAVQLMHARHEKQVIMQNRFFREKQYEEKRLQEFQDVLDKDAVLVKEEKLEHMEKMQREREVHEQIMAERAEERFRKHYNVCRGVVEHIVDLVTKIAEYRELTLNLIPSKMMREWKEMFFHELPIYDQLPSEPQSGQLSVRNVELAKEELLNIQDYEDYKMMTGEWSPAEDGDVRGPPANNNILGHVIHRIFEIVYPTKPPTPPPVFPPFPIKACILGKLLAGKTTCIQYLTEALQIRDLVPDALVRAAVLAFEEGECMDVNQTPEEGTVSMKEMLEAASFYLAPSDLASASQSQEITSADLSSSKVQSNVLSKNSSRGPLTDPMNHDSQDSKALNKDETSAEEEVLQVTESQISIPGSTGIPLSVRAQLGARAARFLRKGKSVPDELLVEIVVEYVRSLPAECGWILDGFPVTIKQAKLLEKWLTGADPDKESRTSRMSKTSLAIDTRAPKDPPPLRPALDIVILLEVSDNTVLARYSENTASLSAESESWITDLLHRYSKGSLTVSETSPQNEEQLVPRLTAFLDNWPKLEKWFEKKKILLKVNGELEQDELMEKLETILVEALYKKQCQDAVSETPADAAVIISPAQVDIPAEPESPKSSKEGKSARNSSASRISTAKGKSKMGMSLNGKKSEKSASAIGKGKKGKGKLDPTPEPVSEPQLPRTPPPKPGSDQWVYVDEPIPQEVAEYLAAYWNNIEATYINTVHCMMQEERSERNRIINYLHKIREDYQEYLQLRPDHKQEFVSQWQGDYNSISEDLRLDEDVKAELLLRLYNLRELLWDIADNRKAEAERERMNIILNGWLEDHLGLLLNIYSTLMQVEIDRFQDTYRFLQDYYKVMERIIPPEKSSEFSRIPLVNTTNVQIPTSVAENGRETGSGPGFSQADRHAQLGISSPLPEAKGQHKVEEGTRVIPSASNQSTRQGDLETSNLVPGGKEEQNPLDFGGSGAQGPSGRVPLVPYRIPSSSFEVKEKPKSVVKVSGKVKEESVVMEVAPLTDVDEYLILEAYQTATSTLSNIIQTVVKIKEEDEKNEQKLKEEKEKELQKSAGKEPKKKGGKSADKKKGAQSLTPSIPPPVIESPEIVKKRELKERIFTEYMGALEGEAQAVRLRLELIRLKVMSVVQELKSKAHNVFTEMEDWLGSRFLLEMESINTLLDVGLGHVDAGTKIEHQLILRNKEFFVNGDVKMIPDPPPLTRLPSEEIAKDGELTIEQLQNLYRQFLLVAPTGLMLKKTFIELLQDLVSLDLSSEQLPEQWRSLSYTQVLDITRTLSPESDLLDWRRFLLSAAQPWPYPSLTDLLDTKTRFQDIDRAETGYVTEEQYNQVELWFKSDAELQVPDDPVTPLPFHRLKQLRQLFFTFFMDEKREPPELDYTNMLLHFSAHRDPVQGFHRSLSVAAGTDLTWNPDTDPIIVKPDHCIDRQSSGIPFDGDDGVIASSELVPIHALFQMLTHGVVKSEDTHRHTKPYETEQLYCKLLTQIYQQSGSKEFEPVPFKTLLRHPFMMDLIKSTLKFTLPDFKAILQRKPVESEAIASSSPELSVETSSNTPTDDTGIGRRRIVKT